MARNRRPLSRAARLTKEWFGFSLRDSVTDDPESAILPPGAMIENWIISPFDAIADFDEPTIMRCLINVSCAFNPALADGGSQLVSLGIRVATDLSAALGTPNTPFTQPWNDWIWSTYISWCDFPSASALAGQPAGYSYVPSVPWDQVKTRRRLEAGEGLLLVMRNEFQVDGGYVNVNVNGRVLVAH